MSIIIPSEHNCNCRSGKTWHTYKYLEDQLLNTSRYITLSREKNAETWSEELASLLILTGSAIDTFFREMKTCPYLQNEDSFKNVDERVKKREESGKGSPFWDINDFRDAFNPFYEFHENLIQAPFGLDNYGELKPFEKFSKKEEVPSWWTNYNHVKHDYYKNIKEANLDSVINAQGGLLILNSLHKCSQEYFIKSRHLKDETYMIERLAQSKIGCKYPIPYLIRPYIQTSIFVFNLREDKIESVSNHFR